ncbi:MAG: hypothetical protein M1827_002198 [Pycnora praestabilis]|nr:MAG: hypothetical protein M1827_002198 [Pycnora praestabilis]
MSQEILSMNPSIGITTAYASNEDLIKKVDSYMKGFMSNHDSSHDYQHVLRVHNIAHGILHRERKTHPFGPTYRTDIVALAALLHDVGDRKYSEVDTTTREPQNLCPVSQILLSFGAEPRLAHIVQSIVNQISYSTEMLNPEHNLFMITTYPEIAIVQDADRLDALGAIGIGRTFTFGGAKRPDRGMQGSIEHFKEKLVRLEGMMKTETGRQIARVRTERLRVFGGWWDDEIGIASDLTGGRSEDRSSDLQ